jgi:hypothetical protein
MQRKCAGEEKRDISQEMHGPRNTVVAAADPSGDQLEALGGDRYCTISTKCSLISEF